MSLLLDSSAIVSCLVTTPSRDFFIESVTADPEWFASAISLNECVALVPLLNELAPDQAVLEEEIHRLAEGFGIIDIGDEEEAAWGSSQNPWPKPFRGMTTFQPARPGSSRRGGNCEGWYMGQAHSGDSVPCQAQIRSCVSAKVFAHKPSSSTSRSSRRWSSTVGHQPAPGGVAA